MKNFDEKYFTKFSFTKEEIDKNFQNAVRDIEIAEKDGIPEVKFNYSYSALIKTGLAILSLHQLKAKSVPGHHIEIINGLSRILKDQSISEMGNLMRSKRNMDFYSGGIEITDKECLEYLAFAKNILNKALFLQKSS